MKNRIKVTTATLTSRAEADRVLGEVRALTIERAHRLLEIETVRKNAEEAHAPWLAKIEDGLKARTEQLRAWAEASPSEFGDRKSLELTHGTIGWRIGQPTLKTLSGWTWDRVLAAIRDRAFLDFLRVKEEPNKQALLAAREQLGDAGLRNLGLRVIQEEPFFIEPKIDQPETRIAAEGAD